MRLKAITAIILITGSLQAQWQQMQLDDSDMATDLAEALTFTKYATYPQYVEMMHHFAESHPEICRLDTFGTSEQGRLLLAMKISDNPGMDEAEASFLYTATMHGNELVGYPLMLRLIDFLLSGYGTDTEVTPLVDNLAIWINPLSNPDGTFYPDNDASVAASIRHTSDSTELNRDFPDPAQGEPDDPAGRARETQAMMEFLREHRFSMSANIHSGEEVVNYPWDHTFDLHADDAWYRFVSREYADEARAVDPEYMDLWEDGITNGAQWYRIFGGRQDYMNYYLGGREVTLELSEAFRMESEYLDEFWQKNQRSLLNYMAQCMYGIRGTVTDLSTGDPVLARIEIPGHDSTYSVVHSSTGHGDFYRLIAAGVYDLEVSATGYLPRTIPGVAVSDHTATLLDISLEPWGLGLDGSDPVSPSIHIYPNPAREILRVEPRHMPLGRFDLTVLSVDGRVALQHSLHHAGQPVVLSLGPLPGGMYILKVVAGDHTYHLPFIRE